VQVATQQQQQQQRQQQRDLAQCHRSSISHDVLSAPLPCICSELPATATAAAVRPRQATMTAFMSANSVSDNMPGVVTETSRHLQSFKRQSTARSLSAAPAGAELRTGPAVAQLPLQLQPQPGALHLQVRQGATAA
jgi:hypothetical protein